MGLFAFLFVLLLFVCYFGLLTCFVGVLIVIGWVDLVRCLF